MRAAEIPGRFTDGTITLMGARPYQTTQGRFLTTDPIDGGCANPYTYAYGDPTNHPDLSGEGIGSWLHGGLCWVSRHRVAVGIGLGAIAVLTGGIGLAVGGTVLGAVSLAAGAGATWLDSNECLAEHDAACFGMALGLAGTGGGLVSILGLGSDLLKGLAAAKGLSLGAGALAYDSATALTPKRKTNSC